MATTVHALKMFVVAQAVNGTVAFNDFSISGKTFEPVGDITHDGIPIICGSPGYEVLSELATICSMCNDSVVVYKEDQCYEKVKGCVTDAALLVLSEKMFGLPRTEPPAELTNSIIRWNWWKVFSLQYSEDRNSKSSFCLLQNGVANVFVNGNEALLDRCTHFRNGTTKVSMTPSVKAKILAKCKHYRSEALDCFVLGTIDSPLRASEIDLLKAEEFVQYEQGITFVGVVGVLAPRRSFDLTQIVQSYASVTALAVPKREQPDKLPTFRPDGRVTDVHDMAEANGCVETREEVFGFYSERHEERKRLTRVIEELIRTNYEVNKEEIDHAIEERANLVEEVTELWRWYNSFFNSDAAEFHWMLPIQAEFLLHEYIEDIKTNPHYLRADGFRPYSLAVITGYGKNSEGADPMVRNAIVDYLTGRYMYATIGPGCIIVFFPPPIPPHFLA